LRIDLRQGSAMKLWSNLSAQVFSYATSRHNLRLICQSALSATV